MFPRSKSGSAAAVRIAATLSLALAMVLAAPPPAHASGETIFTTQCSLCHQPDGAGLAGQFPRLAGRVPVISADKAGRRYLALVLLHGLYGPITVDGKPISGVMPAIGAQPDQAIADVLNHLLTLGKPAGKRAPFTAAEVAAARAEGSKSGSDVAAERTRLAALKVIP